MNTHETEINGHNFSSATFKRQDGALRFDQRNLCLLSPLEIVCCVTVGVEGQEFSDSSKHISPIMTSVCNNERNS